MKRSKNLLVISGHDPTGGAGIQADIEVSRNFNIKVFSVLTCTTIQNTSKVTKVTSSKKNYINKSINEIIKEFKIDGVKIGVIPNLSVAKEIYNSLIKHKLYKKKIILDPIIYSESGYKFISDITRKYIINKILPLCFIVTPNEFEDKIIGDEINTFSGYYLITGIKTKDKVKCYLYKNKRLKKIFTNDKDKKVFHGTGCALSTSIACNLINGEQIIKSILKSLLYISKCIKKSNLKGKKQFLLNK